jgi:hypothetical protein
VCCVHRPAKTSCVNAVRFYEKDIAGRVTKAKGIPLYAKAQLWAGWFQANFAAGSG